MAKPKQEDMFPQKKINAIEKWADKFDEKRALIAGLTGERDNAELKLREAMHSNEDALDVQSDPATGEKILVYKRGDYKVVVKQGKEVVNVKIKDASKDAPTADDVAAEGGEE